MPTIPAPPRLARAALAALAGSEAVKITVQG